jgi:HTH-type transcriptional regulator/antitoxin HigA
VEKKVGAVAAWIREGERQATSLRCAPFDEARFRQTLREVRRFAAEHDPSQFMRPLTDACAAAGIAVVLV